MPQKKKKPSKVSKEDIKHTDPLATLTQKKDFSNWLKTTEKKQNNNNIIGNQEKQTSFLFLNCS